MRVVRLLIAVAALWSTAAIAQNWVVYAETDKDIYHYIPESIKQTKGISRVWALVDLKGIGERGELSTRSLMEINCIDETFRLLQASHHSERQAGGRTLWSSNGSTPWHHIPPGTIMNTLGKKVCGK